MDEDIGKKINSAVFPGLQGGPLMHVIAAKAVAFGEALQPEFKRYSAAVVENAKVLAETLVAGGFAITTGGTDNHLMLVDLRPKKLTGKGSEHSLERGGHHLQQERHTLRSGEADDHLGRASRHAGGHDPRLRHGRVPQGRASSSSACWTGWPKAIPTDNSAVEREVRAEVAALCRQFPIYDGPR